MLWNSKEDFRPWHWMRDHENKDIQWLYTRVQAHEYGKADVSDAGLLYWLLLGDGDGSPEKLRLLLNDLPKK